MLRGARPPQMTFLFAFSVAFLTAGLSLEVNNTLNCTTTAAVPFYKCCLLFYFGWVKIASTQIAAASIIITIGIGNKFGYETRAVGCIIFFFCLLLLLRLLLLCVNLVSCGHLPSKWQCFGFRFFLLPSSRDNDRTRPHKIRNGKTKTQ